MWHPNIKKGVSGHKAIGLDIGTYSIKSVKVEHGADSLKLTSFDSVDILKSEDDTPNYESKRIEALNSIIGSHKIKAERLVTALSCDSMIVRQIKYPVMSYEEIRESIKWEAKKYIPFDIESAEIDFQILSSNGTNDIDLLIVAVKKEMVEDHRKLIKAVKLPMPAIIDLAPIALVNLFLFNYKEYINTDPVVLVDIGANSTILSIYKEGYEYFLRMLSVSGGTITSEIKDGLNISLFEAEDKKMGMSSMDITIETIVENLALDIKKSLTYYNNITKNKGFYKIILSGGGALLAGLPQFIADKLEIETELFDPLKGLEMEIPEEELNRLKKIAPSMALSIALAVRGAVGKVL